MAHRLSVKILCLFVSIWQQIVSNENVRPNCYRRRPFCIMINLQLLSLARPTIGPNKLNNCGRPRVSRFNCGQRAQKPLTLRAQQIALNSTKLIARLNLILAITYLYKLAICQTLMEPAWLDTRLLAREFNLTPHCCRRACGLEIFKAARRPFKCKFNPFAFWN